jgi:penicillin-binding protein-related factor A (putative recombinase)
MYTKFYKVPFMIKFRLQQINITHWIPLKSLQKCVQHTMLPSAESSVYWIKNGIAITLFCFVFFVLYTDNLYYCLHFESLWRCASQNCANGRNSVKVITFTLCIPKAYKQSVFKSSLQSAAACLINPKSNIE